MSETLEKMVYAFGGDKSEGDKSMKELLGGKGANLSEMCAIGLPVPPGFTISTATCRYYSEHGHEWPEGLEEQVREGVRHLEEAMGGGFGEAEKSLVVRVCGSSGVSWA